MFKGLAADLTGSADICRVLKDTSKALACAYLVPGESVLYALQSGKEEFAFTNEALICTTGESATTTRKLVERFDYKSHIIAHLQFETAGVIDRDCEIKFQVGTRNISIDIAKDEESQVQLLFKTLELLSRKQKENERQWEFGKLALETSANTLRLTENSGQTLTKQADETHAWIQALYARTHPRCYKDVILNAFDIVRSGQKMKEKAEQQ